LTKEYEVARAMYIQVMVFWEVTPHFIIERYQRFAGKYCLHHQGQRKRSSKVSGYIGQLQQRYLGDGKEK
jgi:hypothetical protein